jgi:hypothetical protein
MPVHFANGLFDQPWLVAVFIIVGLISNWLMKRRQEQEAARRPEAERPSAPEKPEEEFDLETAMRRLLGEPPPAQSSPPPVITGSQRPPPLADARQSDAEALRSELAWQEESEEGLAEDGEQLRSAPPPLRPPSVLASSARVTVLTEAQAQAARRFVQSSAKASERSATILQGSNAPSVAEPRTAYWRNPRNARQAFVASLVFGSPKGLES